MIEFIRVLTSNLSELEYSNLIEDIYILTDNNKSLFLKNYNMIKEINYLSRKQKLIYTWLSLLIY